MMKSPTTQRSCMTTDLIPEKKVRQVLNNDKHWARWEGRSKAIDLPKRYENAKLEDFGESMKSLIGQSIFVHGPAGTGKTHLLAALARRQVAMGLDTGIPPTSFYAKFTTIPNLLAKIKQSFKDDTEELVFSEYAKCNWLYIDDFGAEKETDWSYQIIYRIIDYRWGEMLPTIVSSNFTPTELSEDYCQRLASRVTQVKTVCLTGSDRRSLGAR